MTRSGARSKMHISTAMKGKTTHWLSNREGKTLHKLDQHCTESNDAVFHFNPMMLPHEYTLTILCTWLVLEHLHQLW